MSFNISVGVATYNPEMDRFEKCIAALCELPQIFVLYIVDNHSENIDQIRCCVENASFKYVHIIQNEKNEGIAFALNQIFESSLKSACDWVLTLDQDSIVPKNLLSYFNHLIEERRGEEIGILCPSVYDLNSKSISRTSLHGISEIDYCITSGSFTNVKAYQAVNGFDSIMFIDAVDHDFCFRIRKAGYKILQCNDIVLQHEVGKITFHCFLWRKVECKNHSAFRKYYIIRNIFYFDYKHYRKIRFTSIVQFVKYLLLTLLYESSKIPKLTSMCKGAIDGCLLGHSLFVSSPYHRK